MVLQLHSLSTDDMNRGKFCCSMVLLQSVDLMMLSRFQPVVLGLMYHISIEDRFKSLFTYTECIPRIYDMLMRVQVQNHGPDRPDFTAFLLCSHLQ
jgi:hypothetical protein